MYVRKGVVCEWCQWNYKNLSFTASRSWRKSFFTIVCRVVHGCSHLSHAECVMYMQRNGYSFTVFLGEPDSYWFDWLKTATDFASLVPGRKGMDSYRASNSSSWGAAVEGAVCKGLLTISFQAQKPACPWEFYICTEVAKRLRRLQNPIDAVRIFIFI
jgi:hypothetical protein